MTGYTGSFPSRHPLAPPELWSAEWWMEVLQPPLGPDNGVWYGLAELDQRIDGRLLQALKDALAACYGDRVREPYESDLPHVAFLRVLEFWLDYHAGLYEVPPRPYPLRLGLEL